MSQTLAMQHVESALKAADWDSAEVLEKVEMLIEIATGLQVNPQSVDELHGALQLYDRASELCPSSAPLLAARIGARRGTVLHTLPGATSEQLEQSLAAFENALNTLSGHGSAEEIAELEMNLGLVRHSLSSVGKAQLNEAVAHYHRALRIFTREQYPTEYVNLHNNLATAYLAMPSSDQSGKLREALAVQSFEAALEVITLVDNPNEYAMLQNNLGNALQNSASGDSIANRFRAVEAYDEALKVRNASNQPEAYANTIANLALCLSNLPDDMHDLQKGNSNNLKRAQSLYKEAIQIFQTRGELEKVSMVTTVLAELSTDQQYGDIGHA